MIFLSMSHLLHLFHLQNVLPELLPVDDRGMTMNVLDLAHEIGLRA